MNDYYLLKDVLQKIMLEYLTKKQALEICGILIDNSKEDGDTWKEFEDLVRELDICRADEPDLGCAEDDVFSYIENFKKRGE